MSNYYNPQRKGNLYDPSSSSSAKGGQAFKLSRSKIDLFLNCPRCFYFDRRLGVARPPGFPFALNSAVDHLLKLEFDVTQIPYVGDDTWVEEAVVNAHKCLKSDEYPESGNDCDYCAYHKAITQEEK